MREILSAKKAKEQILKGRVFFEKTVFDEDLDLEEVLARNNLVFNGATFGGNVYFNRGTFNGSLVFEDVTFEGDVFLDGILVNNGLSINRTTFRGIMSLSNGAAIKDEVEIRESTFNSFLYLEKTNFGSNLNFDKVTLNKNLYLNGTIIKKNLFFDEVILKGNLYFRGTTVKRYLKLSTKEGPKAIFVSRKIAELIHLAAPTIPLVLIKE